MLPSDMRHFMGKSVCVSEYTDNEEQSLDIVEYVDI